MNKNLNNPERSYASYELSGSTNSVVTAVGSTSHGHLEIEHGGDNCGEFSMVEEDGSGLLVTARPASGGQEDAGVEMMGHHARQTITLSLDEATQYLLQQQGISTQAIEMEDGSYQLFDQPVIQVQREDGTLEAQTLHVEVLQALQGELVQQLQPSLDVGYSLVTHAGEEAEGEASQVTGASGLDEIEEEAEPSTRPIEESLVQQESDINKENEDCDTEQGQPQQQTQDLNEESMNPESETQQPSLEVDSDKAPEEPSVKKEPAVKEADLANPIPLSNQTVITVNGKKCVLSFDTKTQQVCAYPIKTTKNGKRRGRPRLTEAEKVAARQRKLQQEMELAAMGPSSTAPSEKSSAAETLLELSNTGSGGIRRSGRARKKAKVLDDFEELEDSEEDDGPAFEDNREKDPDISLELPEAKRKRMMISKKEQPQMLSAGAATPGAYPTGVKRGRGRPRRYPLPGQQQGTPKSIPAVMLPSADGQTLVMAPIQDLQNLQNIRRQLPQLVPKPPEPSNTDVAPNPVTAGDNPDSHNLALACSDADSLPLDTAGVLDGASIIPQALQGDNIPLVGDTADSSDHGDGLDTSPTSLLNLMATTGSESDKAKAGQTSDMADPQQPPTVIHIPDNLLASLGFKKDPIKIGLKASERELEKLKCPKCDFQCYYSQQYRNHIATHGDDIQKCKCCSFISLDREELLQHFKEYHPRCICLECGYMAEHAYIIKRHMMRHDVKSCTCNICGKVYKDMYILKMHIKMVHMPAEVLFECDVCSKKFTRKAHLKRHMRIHEPEKPFKCSLCDYRGCERSDISKHMLIHQEPKHACERCGKTFRHIKNKELHVKRHFGQRDYKCGVCDFFGYTFTDIRKHIERKHQDIKTLICDKCGRHFRNEIALKEHAQSCNVMMIEQVLAIPTSGGRTNQATIQIPTHHLGPHLGSLGGVLALDPATPGAVPAEVSTGEASAAGVPPGVSIMVTTAGQEQNLGLVEASALEEEEEEEEELEEEEEEHDGSAMHLISRSMMREAGGEEGVLGGAGPQSQMADHSDMMDQGGHYISTSSGIHLITTTTPSTTAAAAAAAGECHLAGTKREVLGDGSQGGSHLVSVDVADEGSMAQVKTDNEILVSMDDWNTSSQQEAFHGNANISTVQHQSSAS